MKTILENMYSLENGDKDAMKEIQGILDKFPNRQQYRVEAFISPQFVRITVYKMEFKA